MTAIAGVSLSVRYPAQPIDAAGPPHRPLLDADTARRIEAATAAAAMRFDREPTPYSRIAVVGDGIGVWVARELQRIGHDVTLYGMAGSGDPRLQPLHTVAAYQYLPYFPDPENPLKHRQCRIIVEGNAINRAAHERMARPGRGGLPVLNIEPFTEAAPWPGYLSGLMQAASQAMPGIVTLPNTEGTPQDLVGYQRFQTVSVDAAVAWGGMREEFVRCGGTYIQEEMTPERAAQLGCPVIFVAGTQAGRFIDDPDLDFYKGVAGVVQGRIPPVAISYDDVIVIPRADGTYVIGSPYRHEPDSHHVEPEEAEGILASALQAGQTPIGEWPGLPDAELERLGSALDHVRRQGELPPGDDIRFLTGQRVVPKQGVTIRRHDVPASQPHEGLRLSVYGAGSIGGSIAPFLGVLTGAIAHAITTGNWDVQAPMLLMPSDCLAAWPKRERLCEDALLIWAQQCPVSVLGHEEANESWLIDGDRIAHPAELAQSIVDNLDRFVDYRYVKDGALDIELQGDYFGDDTAPYLQRLTNWIAFLFDLRGEPVTVRLHAECRSPVGTDDASPVVREWVGDPSDLACSIASPRADGPLIPYPHLIEHRVYATSPDDPTPHVVINGTRTARPPDANSRIRYGSALPSEPATVRRVQCNYVHWTFLEDPGQPIMDDIERLLGAGGTLTLFLHAGGLDAATGIIDMLRRRGFEDIEFDPEFGGDTLRITAQRSGAAA
jgi:hypothetical protein